MKPSDFVTVALDLVNKAAPTAADLRTAVSRAYYALYNTAVAFLSQVGLSAVSTQEAHREIPKGLRHCADPKLMAVAAVLDGLRTARWEADYDMAAASPEHLKTVKKHVHHAKQAVKELEACEQDKARFQAARNSLRSWAAGVGAAGFRVN
jgi:hypothetical protein